MRKSFLAACCLGASLQFVAIAASAQALQSERSSMTATFRAENAPVEGLFRRFTGELAFDPARPEAGKARIDIDITSFDLGNADFNDTAKGRDWFNARDFPRASFVSSSMRALGGGRFEVRGSLTLKGRTADVSVPFTYRAVAGSGMLDGAFTIKRLQYNIGEGAWKDTDVVADDVQVKFHLVLAAAKPVPAGK